MARKKTSKETLNEAVEIDGKLASNKPTSLEQIWGIDGSSKYGTMELASYEARLNDMLPVDIQNHARDVGLRPDVDTDTLRKRLVVEFQKHVASYQGSTVNVKNSRLASLPNDIRKILREGA